MELFLALQEIHNIVSFHIEDEEVKRRGQKYHVDRLLVSVLCE